MNKRSIAILIYFLSFFHVSAQVVSSKGWIAKTTGEGEENVTGLVADEQGNLFVTQSFNHRKGTTISGANGKLEISAVPEVDGYSNTLFSSYDINGNILWSIKLEGAGSIKAWKLSYGKDGYLYLCGNFNRDAVFNSTDNRSQIIPTQEVVSDQYRFYRFFIAKYSREGILQWVKHGHSQDNMAGFDIVADADGNSYTWLYSAGSNVVIDDVVLTSKGSYPRRIERYNLIISKINKSGNIEWCLIGNENIHIRAMNITQSNELELIAHMAYEKNYFLNTNQWDTLFSHPLQQAGNVRIHITEEGKLKTVKPIFSWVKNGDLKSIVSTANGYCAVFCNTEFPQLYSSNRLIVLDKDSIRTNKKNDVYIVFADKNEKLLQYAAVEGNGDDKYRDITVMDNGIVNIGVLCTPETVLKQTKQTYSS